MSSQQPVGGLVRWCDAEGMGLETESYELRKPGMQEAQLMWLTLYTKIWAIVVTGVVD